MSEFVPFEIAKKLKEKGFKEKVYGYYDDKERFFAVHPKLDMNDAGYRCSAPTISQVLKWLIEEKRIYLGITYVPEIEKCSDFYFPTIQYIGKFKPTMYTKATDNFKTYEEAAFAGIEYVLDNLI